MNYESSFKSRLIYVFRINDKAHDGALKIGETSAEDVSLEDLLKPGSDGLNAAAKKRIREYTRTAGIGFDLLYTEGTLYKCGKGFAAFNDKQVHEILKRSGIKKKDFDIEAKADEWFITDLDTVKKAIAAAKDGRLSLSASEIAKDKTPDPVVFRPEQNDAIKKTIKQFKRGNQMLWNAKMRFGKTLCALQVVKEIGFKRTLILTHRPVVNEGWFEDFGKIFYDRGDFYQYGSKNKGNPFDVLERGAKRGDGRYVYFASMQDLRGSEQVGGNFDKNNEIFRTPWDLIIVDEAHEGTTTELGKAVIKELLKDDTKILRLSGTPFNLLSSFEEDEIFTWDYVMEQRAKADWDITHKGDHNPYSVLPKLNIYTFDLGKLVKNFSDNDLAFNFHEFFRCGEDGSFAHEGEVKSFLNLICKKDANSNYPFSTDEFRKNFRHSLWMVPGVAAAKALSKILKDHKVFGNYDIVNVAGAGDEEEVCEEALKKVRNAITNDPEATYTITLSCGRLTTGVSVPEWTAVFMLSGSANTAAAGYMQTIFRVQTPATINGCVKEECFVFDFAPDRTLKVLAETAKISAKAGKTTQNDRDIMGDFLNFCPVIGFDGTKMSNFDVEKMLGQLKRVQVERVVRNGFEDNCLYNDELLKLDKLALKDFENLKKIIGTTKAMAKSNSVDINKSGLTNEEYEKLEDSGKKSKKKELTPEDIERLEKLQEARKQRDAASSILRGISIRMPLMIYGADLTDEDEEITIDNFENIVDDASWVEFMPKGVTKELFGTFKKYYEKDIFREAGKRIREMTRAADGLTIEDRINRIGNIFNSFRNPDKETVLTPWRVVNMHLGECLGGYVFFGKDYDNESMRETPRFVDNGVETKKAFASDAKILEINSKSGLYPLYMAYSIYRNRIKKEYVKKDTFDIKEQHELWKKVVAENIFVVCKTPMAVSITKRTLMGFEKGCVNAKYYENLEQVIAKEQETFVKDVKQAKFWNLKASEEMKFNAVVGNPPYQIEGNNNGRKQPIYYLFMDAAFKLSSKVTLITPGRFLFDAGETPKDWNEKMLNDEHFKVIKYCPNSRDIFPSVEIKGGVAITYRDENASFGKIQTFVMLEELNEIINKVKRITEHYVSSITSSGVPYKFSSIIKKDEREYLPLISDTFDLRTNVFDILADKLFFEHKPESDSAYAKILGLKNKKRTYMWIKEKYLVRPDNYSSYKIFLPKAIGSGKFGEVLTSPVIGEKNTGHTQSFISIGNFDTEKEAEALGKYAKTKFFRSMLGVLKITQDITPAKLELVPLQNFTSNSDIDWTKSVSDIDKQLYKKYKLTPTEIEFIETHVKEM